MAHPFTLPEEAKVVGSLKPATDAAGRSGRWINAGFAHKIYAVFHIDQGNAATIALSVQQATDSSGTGAKAITGNVRIWSDQDLATNADLLVRQADGTSFTTDANVKEKLVVIELDPATLDVANGFRYVRFNTGASNVANLTQATILATPLRYPSQVPGVSVTA
jgi:hypothetical protein